MERLFDERLARLGGSDRELFARFVQRGFRIVWADAALVQEWVPPARARLAWILRRGLRVGSSRSFIEREIAELPNAAQRALAEGLRWLALGLLRCPLALARGVGPAVVELRLAATGFGRLAGLLGRYPREYC
jgi:hypothetical protein